MGFERLAEAKTEGCRLARTVMGWMAAACMLAWPAMSDASGPPVGRPAPPLALHTLDGQTIAVSDLRGRVVILTFWATWCGPCREELPLLSSYAQRHSGEGLEVLGISLDGPDNLPAVQKIAGTLSFPVGLLGSAWAGGYGRIWRLPASFIIDRSGVLVENSWNDDEPVWTEARLDHIVEPLLR